MDFSAWVVSGLMVVVGVHVADRLQRRRCCSARLMRVLGRIRALAPVLKMAMAYPLRVRFRTGRDARDVHARRLHDRRRRDDVGLVPARVRRRRDASAAASTCVPRSRPPSPLATTPAAAIRAPASTARRPGRRRRVDRCRQGDAGGTGRAARPTRCAGSTTGFLEQHDLRLRRAGEGLRARARGLGRHAHAPDLAVVDPFAAPRRDNWGFASHAGLPADRLLHRGQHVRPRSRRRPRPADGAVDRADRGRRARGHVAAGDGRDLDLAARRGGALRPARARRRSTTCSVARRRRRGRDGGRELERRSSRTASRPSRSASSLHDDHRRRPTRSTGCLEGFMGLGLDRRRRRARRDQRPLGRRAAPADRRAALDRLPAADGAGQRSCSSRRSSRSPRSSSARCSG